MTLIEVQLYGAELPARQTCSVAGCKGKATAIRTIVLGRWPLCEIHEHAPLTVGSDNRMHVRGPFA